MEKYIMLLAAIVSILFFYKVCETLLEFFKGSKLNWRKFIERNILLSFAIFIYLKPSLLSLIIIASAFLLYAAYKMYLTTNQIYLLQKNKSNN